MLHSNACERKPRHAASFGFVLLGLFSGMFVGCAGQCIPEVETTPRSNWANAGPIVEQLVEHTPQRLMIHHEGITNDGEVPGDEKLRRLLRFSLKKKPWGALATYIKNGWLFEDMGRTRKGQRYPIRMPVSEQTARAKK